MNGKADSELVGIHWPVELEGGGSGGTLMEEIVVFLTSNISL